MKKLSGDFLARLLYLLQHANEKEMDAEELVRGFSDVVRCAENLYCTMIVNDKKADDEHVHKRLELLDPSSLEKLDAMLPWSSYFNFNGNKSLGTAWSERKRHAPMPFPDKGVENLNKLLPLDGMSVLEMGCFEGHHTTSLAMHTDDVWAIDGRIENVIKTLIRVWGAGYEKRVSVNYIDLEQGSLQDQFRALGRDDGFDLIHHRGVLYHLSNPVIHINECSMVCKKHLFLHTQIASDEMANDEYTHNNKSYRVYRYKEPKTAFSPFAGITQYALWLTKSSLLELLDEVGFNDVKILAEDQERNGPRIALLASRI